MNASDLVTAAADAAGSLTAGASTHAFTKAVGALRDVLARVPDLAYAQFPPGTVDAIAGSAERAIGAIEARIEGAHERVSVKRDLANSIYEIRRNLEDIHRWRRPHVK